MPIASAAYPIGLVLDGRRALLVGGGRIALRKLAGLLECGAVVTVVAPRIDEAIVELPVRCELRAYRGGEVASYRLAIAATGRAEVDRQVFRDGEAAGVFVNAADDPDCCSFVLPAVLRRGPVSVAVSTGGTSPAFASWLRDRIGQRFGGEIEALAPLLADTRRRVRAAGRSSEGLAWPALIEDLAPLLASGDSARAAARADAFVDATLRAGSSSWL